MGTGKCFCGTCGSTSDSNGGTSGRGCYRCGIGFDRSENKPKRRRKSRGKGNQHTRRPSGSRE